MDPYNGQINQGRPYNPDFNNLNGNLRGLNNMSNFPNPNPNNFYSPNPNFVQPMPQNNQLAAIQMLASQIQCNPQLQLNLLNQLQSQNFVGAFNHGAYMGPHNHMLGMQNAQMFQQNQLYQGNQTHQGNQMMGYSGFGSGPVTMGLNQGIQNMNAVPKQVKHDDSKTPTKTPSVDKQRSNNRFQKSQTPNKRNSKGNMKQFKRRGGRGGKHNLGSWQPSSMDFSEKGPTIPIRSINYTSTDIQLWLQARKKNFPTKDNIEKKKAGENKNVEDAEAKLRRQQLKEVLQKQAELGVEVAEIPRKYLEEEPEEKKADEKNEVSCRKTWSRGGRRGSLHPRQKRLDNHGKGAAAQSKRREPSLLEKLFSADIKRDKLRLLHAFRFVVSNDFFKKWPETSLVFPTVVLKEANLVEELKLDDEDVDEEVVSQE